MKGWGLSLIALLFLISIVQATNQQPPITVSSYGTVGNSAHFLYKGTTISIKAFLQGYGDYKSNIFTVLNDLGIDTIRVFGAGFSFGSDYASAKAFLDNCWSHNIRAIFHEMGDWEPTNYKHDFNPNHTPDPWAFNIRPELGINDAKAKVDALENAGVLKHPAVPLWIISNECWYLNDLDSYGGLTLLEWHLQLADYMRNKGVKVALGFPSINHGETTPSDVLPLFRDHVDYIIFHWYSYGAFSTIYSSLLNTINTYKQNLGPVPSSNLLIGEIGVQRSEATEQIRGESYRGYFGATFDAEIGGAFPFYLLDQNSGESWGAIRATGEQIPVNIPEDYFPALTDEYKAYYASVPSQ